MKAINSLTIFLGLALVATPLAVAHAITADAVIEISQVINEPPPSPPHHGGGGGGGPPIVIPPSPHPKSTNHVSSVRIIPDDEGAEVLWQTSLPSVATLSWGPVSGAKGGKATESQPQTSHGYYISHLDPATTYALDITINAVDADPVFRTGEFTTLSESKEHPSPKSTAAAGPESVSKKPTTAVGSVSTSQKTVTKVVTTTVTPGKTETQHPSVATEQVKSRPKVQPVTSVTRPVVGGREASEQPRLSLASIAQTVWSWLRSAIIRVFSFF